MTQMAQIPAPPADAEIFGSFSHELRSQLNAIILWAGVLRRGSPDPQDLADGLEAIERNAHGQWQLISDLLDASLMAAGKLELDLRTVDPAELVNSIVAAVSGAARDKSIRLITQLDPAHLRISGDSARLKQAVAALINETIRHTQEGGQIDINLESHPGQAQISIATDARPWRIVHHCVRLDHLREDLLAPPRTDCAVRLAMTLATHVIKLHNGELHPRPDTAVTGPAFVVQLPLVNS